MLRFFGLLAIAIASAAPAAAQIIDSGGGPLTAIPGDDNRAEIEKQLDAAARNARSLGLEARPRVAATRNLDYPLRLRPNSRAYRSSGVSNFVDLNPAAGVRDFACGSRSYDGHKGNDLSLFPFGWRMMDGREVEIVAAAPGVIVQKDDGNFDRRCAFAPGGSVPANFVIVQQDDGLTALYWHMKKGSVTTKTVGTRVVAGDVLGLVGSSGNSTGPHLHFELQTASRQTVDPWQGKCGTSPRTHWRHQPETADTDFLRLATHSADVPASSGFCDNPNPQYANRFDGGDVVRAALYLRDQRGAARIWLVRPDGSIYTTSTTGIGAYEFSYWWWSVTLPSSGAEGLWKLRAKIGSKIAEHPFMVGTMPRATRLRLARTPAARVIPSGGTGIFTVIVRNIGAREAIGCNIGLDASLAADWSVLQVGLPARETNHVFDVPAGGSRKFRLSIKPKNGYKAAATTVPLRATCLNANSPRNAASNEIKLTF